MKLFKTISCANTLGEGVVWDPRAQAVLWTDIEEKNFYRCPFPFDAVEVFPTPERLCSFALLKNKSDQVIAAFETGFALFSFESGGVDWLDRPELPKTARFNDGRVDRNGVFWSGTMIEDPALRGDGGGALFRLGAEGAAISVFGGVQISNSLCWSPDGKIMYFADSPRRTIWAFDFENGAPVNRRVFAETPEGAYPDGSTVDADGFLWNAQWEASRVVRYAPGGAIDLVLEIPAPHVTCAAFGGPELNLLFVTSAKTELDADALARAPKSGDLFIYETPYRGLPENRC